MSNNDKLLTEVNETLREYLKAGYHIPGVTVLTERSEFMRPSIRIVTIDLKNDIYPVSGGKYAFGRPAIQKFVDAGRIELKVISTNVARGRGVARYSAKISGERYELDGSPKRLEDEKTLDLIVREEELRLKYAEKMDKEHPKWTPAQKQEAVERDVRKVMIEKHKYASESAITGAQARVVQKLLGLNTTYTLEALKKPFVVVAMTPVVDMRDHDIKLMVTAHMLGIRETLYPAHSSTVSLSPVVPLSCNDEEKTEMPAEPLPDEAAPLQKSLSVSEFEDCPRGVKVRLLSRLVSDPQTKTAIEEMGDEQLSSLYGQMRAA